MLLNVVAHERYREQLRVELSQIRLGSLWRIVEARELLDAIGGCHECLCLKDEKARTGVADADHLPYPASCREGAWPMAGQ
jgi:hypothetical protein